MLRFLLCAVVALSPLGWAQDNDIPMTRLSTGSMFPLVGMGVGNLQHELIESQIARAVKDDVRCRLIDTARASRNENLVRDGIEAGLTKTSIDAEVHVVTKVWYTYLGYERTMISVKESLHSLRSPDVQIHVHILLHWPRCMDEIPWMECEKEEENLPDYVKEAGPPPHLSKETAWKESWRALEDLYLGNKKLGHGLPKVASIGVSNFELKDLKELVTVSKTPPAIIQTNLWSVLYDPHLMEVIHEHKIHVQVYNVMHGVFSRVHQTPRAHSSLLSVAKSLKKDTEYSPAQVVLKWLSQHDLSSIPRMGSEHHLLENAAVTIAAMPPLSNRQEERVHHAIASMMRGEDLEPPRAEFVNNHSDRTIHLFWSSEDGKELPVHEDLGPGENFNTLTYPGHVFVAYDHDKSSRKEFKVQADYGEHQQFHVEL